MTGKLQIGKSEKRRKSTVSKGGSSLFNSAMSKSVPSNSGWHEMVILTWGEWSFSEFAFDLIARLNGTYRDKQRLSPCTEALLQPQ